MYYIIHRSMGTGYGFRFDGWLSCLRKIWVGRCDGIQKIYLLKQGDHR